MGPNQTEVLHILHHWADWVFVQLEQVDPLHVTIEIIFVLFIIYLLRQKSYKIPHRPDELSEKEVEALVDEWEPVPLVPKMSKHQKWADKHHRVMTSGPSTTVVIDGVKALNFATTNFLGFADSEETKQVAREGIQSYGVGSCGPRGFYGTMDVHVELEKSLSRFMNTEEAILYSAGFATSASAIPAFAKVFDMIICDAGVSHSLQTGVLLSRSKVAFFRHNDMDDLRRILEEVRNSEKATKKSYRKFVVVEGLYQNYGDIAPLKEIMALKKEYALRVIVDDSFGIGTIGKTGRGVCEYSGVDPMQVDVLTASLSHAFGTIGGFCVGKRSVVFHQRLQASGYVYSASSPPYLVAAGNYAVNALSENAEELMQTLQRKIKLLHQELKGLAKHGLVVRGTCKEVAVVHVEITKEVFEAKNKEMTDAEERRVAAKAEKRAAQGKKPRNKKKQFVNRAIEMRHNQEVLLQEISNEALKNGVLLIRASYAESEKFIPTPSIRITVSTQHNDADIKKMAQVLKKVASQVLL